jgi:hypothetical protein
MNNPSNEAIQLPSSLDNEPTDSNPVPLSPTDPKRRTDSGDTPANKDATIDDKPTLGGVVRNILPRSGDLTDMAKDQPASDDAVIRPDSEGQK